MDKERLTLEDLDIRLHMVEMLVDDLRNYCNDLDCFVRSVAIDAKIKRDEEEGEE